MKDKAAIWLMFTIAPLYFCFGAAMFQGSPYWLIPMAILGIVGYLGFIKFEYGKNEDELSK